MFYVLCIYTIIYTQLCIHTLFMPNITLLGMEFIVYKFFIQNGWSLPFSVALWESEVSLTIVPFYIYYIFFFCLIGTY